MFRTGQTVYYKGHLYRILCIIDRGAYTTAEIAKVAMLRTRKGRIEVPLEQLRAV